MPSKSGTSIRRPLFATGPSAHNLINMQVGDDAISVTDLRDRVEVIVHNNAGAAICRLASTSVIADDAEHTLFFSFDGDAGTATFILDGVADENASYSLRVAPTTGTMDSGASSNIGIGGTPGGANLVDGEIGFVGYREGYLTNDTDFFTTTTPNIDIDEIEWTEWGAQPLFWNRTGEMSDNKGSAGNMTINGVVTPPRPLFWSEVGQMSANKGTAGNATANGTITMTTGGEP